MPRFRWFLLPLTVTALGGAVWLAGPRFARDKADDRALPTGHFLTPTGTHETVGSFPVNLAMSPDGRWVACTNVSRDHFLTILDARTGKTISKLSFSGRDAKRDKRESLYFGLAWGNPTANGTPLYASHGAMDMVSRHVIGSDGQFKKDRQEFDNPHPIPQRVLPLHAAGIALNADETELYVVNNQTSALTRFKGSVSIFDLTTGKRRGLVNLEGFPLDAAFSPATGKLYISSERDGDVTVVDPKGMKVETTIRTGTNPTHLLLSRDGQRLFVSNSSSDTVSILNLSSNTVEETILVRPAEVRGLVGCTPLGMSLSADEKVLYVAMGDMNAVAVVDLAAKQVQGYIPTGWYPTDVVVAGSHLLVSCAKGTQTRHPNPDKYVLDLLPGVVSRMAAPNPRTLPGMTAQVKRNNRYARIEDIAKLSRNYNPGIEHVIYIVKENRTYDQFFGDFPEGVGRKDLHLFGDDVIPNQRALARRFALFDNFYVCAEMSADGWSWSTAGIASEYVQRNAPYEYSDRGRNYDYEGQNNGSPVDAKGIRNVNDPGGGYLWDLAIKHGVSLRNYGMYMAQGVPLKGADGQVVSEDNVPAMKALVGRTDPNFRMYDLRYADSDAWVRHGVSSPNQLKTYGAQGAKSRFEAWNREFQEFVRNGNLPKLTILRFGNDHTDGTTHGSYSPRAMISDNDYAVGQLVEAVSKSPYWTKTAIVVIEDDAQGGYDHVDAHRSVCWVISPYVRKGTVDSRFYNTDSAIRTVEMLLGLPPMNPFDAIAMPLQVFGKTPTNIEPFEAILPPKNVIGEVNTAQSYRAAESVGLFNRFVEESMPDLELADLIWGSVKGADSAREVRKRMRALRQ